MKTLTLAGTLTLAATVAVASLPPDVVRLRNALGGSDGKSVRTLRSRAEAITSQAANHAFKASDFLVNSSALPLVTFPLQNSYAGRLPISSKKGESRQLSFWYWPSSASGGSKKLSIWLNGGPGCSSFTGFLTENGPISFKAGASAPSFNPYAWTSASDMLYVEQPVGTGFTLGTPNLTNENQLADQFYGFLQEFYTVFPNLVKKELYITGESYAGFYIPYIASRILHASSSEKKKLPLNLQSLLMIDGVYSSSIVGEEVPVAAFAEKNQKILGLNNTVIQELQNMTKSCGYQKILDAATYPPKGKIPLPNGNQDVIKDDCEAFGLFYEAASEANPCFDIYRVTDKCPTPHDNLEPYFSRADVQKALHFSNFGNWSQCSNNPVFVNNTDNSNYSETLFPDLLTQLPKGFSLWHGLIDSILLSEGTRITIQNLTWGGYQGFQKPITTPWSVNGTKHGLYHSERKLTYIEFDNAGHMIPQDQPEAALHAFKWVLNGGTL
ncbi:Serine carboxypeptidase [Ceratobasidium sp. AG-Ba]|nr:Serine carboxypeptidase [Ceratobasidium sp. AG-Ba]